MALNTEGLSGDALKRAQAYNNALQKAEKTMKAQEKLAGQIGQAFLGVDGSEFFRNLTSDELVKKTSELNEEMKSLNQQAQNAGEDLATTFQKMGETSNLVNSSVGDIALKLNVGENTAQKLLDAFKGTQGSGIEIAKILQDMGEGAEDFVKKLVTEGDFEETLVKQFSDTVEVLKTIDTELAVTQDRMSNINESVFSMKQGFNAVASNLTKDFNLTGLMDSLIQFDATIKQAQIDTGINFTQNASQMALLTSETARFGMSVGDTTDLMGALGSELRTANFDTLSTAANDLASMQKATGLSADNVGKLTKEFMNFGRSSKDVADYAGEVMSEAQAFGLNGREVMEDIAKNMSRMRTMGFVGGEQSLKKMVLEAKRLGIQVDSVFDMAEKSRNVEGAMEMAAELQLAGGSFAQIDPMQLLSAAREGPDAMMNILKQMGSDIGSFNENGEFKIDPIDKDRLKMVSDATGLEMTELVDSITKSAQDVKKADLIGGAMDISSMSDEQKAILMNLTNIGKGGKIELSADAAAMGITSLEQLYGTNMKTLEESMKADKEFLDEQANQNMGFQESKDALMASITNLFSVFQPFLQMITNLINEINKLGPTAKMIIGGGVIAMKLLFGPAKSFMQGFSMGKGFNAATSGGGFIGSLKNIFKGGATPAAAAGGIANQGSALPPTEGATASKGAGGGLKSLSEGLKAMGEKGVTKGILNLMLAAPALVLMLPAIPGLMLMALVGAMGKLVEFGFQSMARGISAMGGAGVIKGAVAMLILGVSLIPFAFALQMMADVEWSTIGMMVVGIIALAGITALIGFIAPLILFGALALAAASVGLLVFGAAIMVFAMASEMMQGMEFSWLGDLGLNLLMAAPGLLLGGLALLMAVPGILLGSLSLIPLMQVAQMAAGIDWSVFYQIGPALMSISGALLAFGAAGLAGGIMGAIGGMLGGGGPLETLQTLADIAVMAANPMQIMSNAIGELADNLQKLQNTAGNLDLEKLESLRSLAWSMAIGAMGGGAMGDAIGKIAEALAKLTNATSGGGGGGGNTRHVVELTLDGKKLKEIEIRDNKYTT
jgi:hypothetical protein